MMNFRKPKIGLAFLLMLMTASHAAALEHKAEAFTLSPMIGYFVFDDDRGFDDDPHYSLGFGYNITDRWSSEFFFGYTNTERNDGNTDYYLWHIDGLYHFNRAERLVPYLATGLGMSREISNDAQNETRVSWNYGGGVKYFIFQNIALRADIRGYYEPQDRDSDFLFNIGAVFQFGGRAAYRAADISDSYCVNVPDHYIVDQWGCPLFEEKEIGFDLAIFFDFDEDTIKPEYEGELRRMAAFIGRYPNLAGIVLEGHADNVGDSNYNQNLSERRAQNVRTALIEQYGIAPERIDIIGFGLLNPIADNSTYEGRQRNRRVVTSIRTVEHIEVATQEMEQYQG